MGKRSKSVAHEPWSTRRKEFESDGLVAMSEELRSLSSEFATLAKQADEFGAPFVVDGAKKYDNGIESVKLFAAAVQMGLARAKASQHKRSARSACVEMRLLRAPSLCPWSYVPFELRGLGGGLARIRKGLASAAVATDRVVRLHSARF